MMALLVRWLLATSSFCLAWGTRPLLRAPPDGAAAADALVLPDVDMTSKAWSGYFTVNATAQRRLFYAFAESERDPEKDPLIFWLAGCAWAPCRAACRAAESSPPRARRTAHALPAVARVALA